MYIKWNLTKKCTLNCKFCHNASERKNWSHDVGIEQLDQIIRNISKTNNLEGISLLGGDPLEYKYITQLAKLLEDRNIPFGFVTAGEEIYKGGYDEILLNKNLNFIGLSIDSLNPGTVKYVRNKDMLQDQLKSLEYILDYKKRCNLKFKFFTNTIFMNINRSEIIDLIDSFKRKKVDKIQILEYKHTKKSRHNFSVSFEEELLFIDSIANYIKENEGEDFSNLELCFLPEPGKDYLRKISCNKKISLGTSSKCPIFRDTLFVSNDGFVYPCDNYKPYFRISSTSNEPEKIYRIENLIEKQLSSITYENEYFKDVKALKEESKEKLFGNLEPCNQCEYLLKECYPCLQYSRGSSTQPYMYDLKCKYYLEKNSLLKETI
ncbi:radical SAM protein [Paenibacillus jiagnxiensis]|uniref:radical SAM protein n=1 Tax=Paenibacillus jiagnxiensis TaxID=3228926 RepID=UPI0033B6F4A9